MLASLSSQPKCYFLFPLEIVCNIYIPPDVTAINSGTNLSDSVAAPTSQVRTMSILFEHSARVKVPKWFCSNHDIIPGSRISANVCTRRVEPFISYGKLPQNLVCMRATWNFNTQNKEWISLHTIICVNLSVSLSVFTSWALKYTDNSRGKCNKCS